jgi:hypothetical protein
VSTRLARTAFVLAVVVNVVVLYAPEAPGGAASIPYLDKVVHFSVFAVVAWTGRWAGVPINWLIGLLAVHAVGSELIQHFLLPNRAGDPWDALADCVGIVAGVLIPCPGMARRANDARAKMSA